MVQGTKLVLASADQLRGRQITQKDKIDVSEAYVKLVSFYHTLCHYYGFDSGLNSNCILQHLLSQRECDFIHWWSSKSHIIYQLLAKNDDCTQELSERLEHIIFTGQYQAITSEFKEMCERARLQWEEHALHTDGHRTKIVYGQEEDRAYRKRMGGPGVIEENWDNLVRAFENQDD